MKAIERIGLALGLLAPATLLAHPADAPLAGFVDGVWHPWGGLDHLLAMMLVGLWAAQRGGQARWTTPLLFVTVMTTGSVLAPFGPALATIDQLTSLTVVTLGALVALSARPGPMLAGVLIGSFALVHGCAHGLEIPAQASRLAFTAGFAISTLFLHLAGMLMASALLKHRQDPVLRAAGASAAIAGLALICNV